MLLLPQAVGVCIVEHELSVENVAHKRTLILRWPGLRRHIVLDNDLSDGVHAVDEQPHDPLLVGASDYELAKKLPDAVSLLANDSLATVQLPHVLVIE